METKTRDSGEGNLKVIARFRPLINIELELSETKELEIKYLDDCTVGIPKMANDYETFSFDRVFSLKATQEEIFEFVGKPILSDVLTGYNGTVFAYGQTGSGKTFTMMGGSEPETKGIIPRAISFIFQSLTESATEIEYTIKCSMLEIYKETLKDLIGSRGELKIKQDKRKGIFVEGLTEVYVVCEEEILEILALGESNRTVASTKMNTASSRSHQLFMIELTQKLPNDSEKRGILNLVDLAGCEKISQTGVTGNKLEEAKKINLSLSALGNVIKSLTDHAEHIPYRDSKLTRLLQESLGGNYKTTLIVNCSPHPRNVEDTINTLKFAQRAKTIKNKATVNIKKSAEAYMRIIEELKKQLAMTIKELEAYKSGRPIVHEQIINEKLATVAENEFSDIKIEDVGKVEELVETINSLKQDQEHSSNKIKELLEEVDYERKKRVKNEKECFEHTLKYNKLIEVGYKQQKNDNFYKDENESLKKQIDVLKFHLKIMNDRYADSLEKLRIGDEIKEWEFIDMSNFSNDKNSKLPVYTETDELDVVNTSELGIDIPINESILISNDKYAQGLCQQLEDPSDVNKELHIFELKKQFINSGIVNCELGRAYYELLWKYKLLREKMNLKTKVIRTQEQRIETLEKMIGSLNSSYIKIVEIIEKLEQDQANHDKHSEFMGKGKIVRFVKPVTASKDPKPFRKNNRTGTVAPLKQYQGLRNSLIEPNEGYNKYLYLESNLQMQMLYNQQLKKANEIASLERNSCKKLLDDLVKENLEVYTSEKFKWRGFIDSFKETCEKELIRKQLEINRLTELLGEWIYKYTELEDIAQVKNKKFVLNENHREEIDDLLKKTRVQMRPTKLFINESPLHCRFKSCISTHISNTTGDSSPPDFE